MIKLHEIDETIHIHLVQMSLHISIRVRFLVIEQVICSVQRIFQLKLRNRFTTLQIWRKYSAQRYCIRFSMLQPTTGIPTN